jgi:hypothetical protein
MVDQAGSPPVVDHHREPCPDRILDDLGSAFSMGAIGGGLFHASKQMIWGPRGHKFRSALEVRHFSCSRHLLRNSLSYKRCLWRTQEMFE